jgi:hypothetical protein
MMWSPSEPVWSVAATASGSVAAISLSSHALLASQPRMCRKSSSLPGSILTADPSRSVEKAREEGTSPSLRSESTSLAYPCA